MTTQPYTADTDYMLTHQELFSVLHGTANLTLTRYKVTGRRKNWERHMDF
jgi:hypothetical protein